MNPSAEKINLIKIIYRIKRIPLEIYLSVKFWK
jgi:hypothetical protein